ncbi:alpha-L-rhamnosidase C-terminal domain-containing protein, partial [Candidatus Omnitrophota bacterium]
ARPVDTPVELTSTAYYFFDANIMEDVAGILGKNRDAERYRRLAETIRASFIKKFYNPYNKTYGSQTGDCFSLYLGLVPEGDEQNVADSLARDILDKHDGHHSTGVTGSLHLYWALGHFGYGDLAHKLLQNTTYPSIGYLFSLGATTLWESWGKRGGSLNHPMQGGFTVWFYQGIAGINPDPENPGFKHTIFRPPVRGNLDSAQARFRSPYGLITSEWSLTEENFNWNVSIPANTTATVYIPSQRSDAVTESSMNAAHAEGVTYLRAEDGCSVYSIESGNYFFSCKE